MTTSTKDLLARLNAYREHMKLKPLKAWKESRAKLEAAVANIPEHMTDEQADANVAADEATREPTKLDYEAANDGVIQGVSPVEHPPEPARRVKPPKASNEGTRTIPELARKLGKKEKVARAKCRRWGSKLRPLMRDAGAWRFDNANTAQVCAILGWEVPEDWK